MEFSFRKERCVIVINLCCCQFEEAEIFNVSDRSKSDNTFHSVRRSKSLRSIVKPLVFRWTDGKVGSLYKSGLSLINSLPLPPRKRYDHQVCSIVVRHTINFDRQL